MQERLNVADSRSDETYCQGLKTFSHHDKDLVLSKYPEGADVGDKPSLDCCNCHQKVIQRSQILCVHKNYHILQVYEYTSTRVGK